MFKWFKQKALSQEEHSAAKCVSIFLDPDGTEDLGLCLLIPSATSVVYENQCGGTMCLPKSLEGFLVPLGRRCIEEEIYQFFLKEFNENCYPPHNIWTKPRLSELSEIISQIPVEGNVDEIHLKQKFLELDTNRMQECIEAWIPVISIYGESILTLKNSD